MAQASGGQEKIARALKSAERVPPPRGGGLDLELARHLRNDTGNARRLMGRFGRDLLFVREVGWHAWTGARWSHDDGERLAQIWAQETGESIFAEAGEIEAAGPRAREDDKEHSVRVAVHNRWAGQSGNTQRLKAMVREARPHLTVGPGDMDTHPRLLNVKNGTLVLEGKVELREHERADRITHMAGVAYDPDAEAPQFRKFLNTILPVMPVQLFVQRWFGYNLTGEVGEQCLVLFHGVGSNGKSTLVSTLGRVMADYAMTLPFASLLHDDKRRGSEATPDLARLPGSRMVWAAEPDLGARLSESVLKSMTGGERIAARHLNKGFFEFNPQFKLVLSFNNRPNVRGQDDGIWRRLMLVPFTVTIPEADRDDTMMERLAAEEGPGILNWMLDGFRLWHEQRLSAPEEVRAATKSYREDSDPVGRFIEAALTKKPGASVTAKTLFDGYVMWCDANAVSHSNQHVFGRIMAEKGYQKGKAGITFYKDVELNPYWIRQAEFDDSSQ